MHLSNKRFVKQLNDAFKKRCHNLQALVGFAAKAVLVVASSKADGCELKIERKKNLISLQKGSAIDAHNGHTVARFAEPGTT